MHFFNNVWKSRFANSQNSKEPKGDKRISEVMYEKQSHTRNSTHPGGKFSAKTQTEEEIWTKDIKEMRKKTWNPSRPKKAK